MTKARRIALVVAACVLTVAALGADMAFHLIFGWMNFMRDVLPRVVVRWDGVLIFAVGLTLFSVLLHRVVGWFRSESRVEDVDSWSYRSTLRVTGLVVCSFAAGIAFVGIVHQCIWMLADEAPLRKQVAAVGVETPLQLKMTGIAILNASDTYGRLPNQVPLGEDVYPRSWAAVSMQGFGGWNIDIDPSLPWDHPSNRPVTTRLVPTLLNPALAPTVLRDDRGFGVTHFAGNAHVFGSEIPVRLDDVESTKLLLVGEIPSDPPAWADPRATRDPTIGLGTDPRRAFGSPDGTRGTLFLLADGSVESLAEEIDPSVLDRLATPRPRPRTN